MNIYEKLLNNQRKYLSDKGTIDVNTRIENLKKLKTFYCFFTKIL